MEQANPGDIVALASGGPEMTVLSVRYEAVDGSAVAIAALGWFTAVGEYRTGELPLKVLVLRRAAGADGERSRTDVELHAAEAHPDFEYESVTFVGRTADPDIAPNANVDGAPWVRNLHRHDGWARFADREVTYWMRRKVEPLNDHVLDWPPAESPQMVALHRSGRR